MPDKHGRDFEATDVTFSVRGEPAQAEVHLYGVYNVYNAAAALALLGAATAAAVAALREANGFHT